MNEEEFNKFVMKLFRSHGLWEDGWRFLTVSHFPSTDETETHGYTDVKNKIIFFSRDSWPTLERNMKEVVRHEIAHALVGHGEHTLDWWDMLIDIGGRGIWVENESRIKSVGVTVVYK